MQLLVIILSVEVNILNNYLHDSPANLST